MVKEKIIALGTGLAGAGSVEMVDVATSFDPEPITQGVGLISQLIILVATLVRLFKKKKVAENLN